MKNLTETGFVTQTQKNTVKVFTAVPIEKIEIMFDQRIKNILETKKEFQKTFLEIQSGASLNAVPKMQIFEGEKEMQHLTHDVLMGRNFKTQSYWPIKTMIEALGSDFFRQFNIERIKRNIYVQAIWPESQAVDMQEYPFMGAGPEFLRDIRIAPTGIDFSMGYWIYNDKVACVSSRKSNFGFIIENAEFAHMMKTQFDALWALSKNLDVTDQQSKKLFAQMMK